MRKTLFLGAWAIGVLALLNPPARAVDGDSVKRAVDAGVAYLKQQQDRDGTWSGNVGATSLAAMTLLECGVAIDDDAIKRAAEVVRTSSVSQTGTYEISLAILFLDKMRDPVDIPLIESLTVKLMAGQNAAGGWGYSCPQIADSEVKRLLGLLQNRNELVGKRDLPKGDDTKRSPKDLPKEIQEQIGIINRGVLNPVQGRDAGNVGDNSNTQFATLALWVARRHGLPVEKAVGGVNKRFRATVNADGGWAYIPATRGPGMHHGAMGGDSTASMTSAGLLGLAVGYGVVGEMAEEKAMEGQKDKDKDKEKKELPLPDMTKDAILLRGLAALSTSVGVPAEKLKAAGRPAVIPQIGGQSFYFLWSLERVCVALDLDTIGGKDWYGWGAELLLVSQQADGSWQGQYSGNKADTCFALLFLKRANFTRDLSARLKGKLDQNTLRGGGVGGEGLKDKLAGGVTKPGEGSGDKPTDPKDPKDPKPVTEGKESELVRKAVEATGERQQQFLAELRDGAGRKYTDALLVTISQLTADSKKSARRMLAERLAQEAKDSPDKLTDYLDDRDTEIRRAAVLACALNDSKAHISQLIGMLRDREPLISRATWASLKNMTKQDFGPTVNATDEEKAKAIQAWSDWWAKNKK
jgi:hypothetical protein